MSRLLLLVALLLSAVPASAQDRVGPAPYLVLTIGSGVDLVTTLDATLHGRGREANPVLSHGGTPGLVAGKVGATVALGLMMRGLAAKGHPRAARIVGYVTGLALAGVAAHNAQVGR